MALPFFLFQNLALLSGTIDLRKNMRQQAVQVATGLLLASPVLGVEALVAGDVELWLVLTLAVSCFLLGSSGVLWWKNG